MDKIRILLILMLVFLASASRLYPESKSEHFNLICDVLDGSSGGSQSSHFTVKVSSTGQPSPTSEMASASLKIRSGYVYSASVLHGDANADGVISLGDVVYLNSYLYSGGPPPIPFESGDVNCDRTITLGDLVYLISYLYKGGLPPCDPPLETVMERSKE